MAALVHPIVVAPLVVIQVGHDRGGFGAHFLLESVGIALFVNVPFPVFDLEFVGISCFHAGDEQIPNAAVHFPHLVLAAVPVVEIAQDGNITRVGGPNGEVNAADSFNFREVGPQFFVNAVVIAFAKEVNVKIGDQGRSKSVGVIEHPLMLPFLDPQLVVGDFVAGDNALKKVRMMHRDHRHFKTFFGKDRPSGAGAGQIGPNCPGCFTILLKHQVGAKDFKGIVMMVVNNPIDLILGNGRNHRAIF